MLQDCQFQVDDVVFVDLKIARKQSPYIEGKSPTQYFVVLRTKAF